MDFWKWPFMQCVIQLLVNKNILQSFKSESAPCIKLLKRVVFKTNHKLLHVDVNMKH